MMMTETLCVETLSTLVDVSALCFMSLCNLMIWTLNPRPSALNNHRARSTPNSKLSTTS
ncbi:hypothetical protein HZ326_1085, partial [Fusarium oxysporum f. sp. albedinis]